MGRIHQKCEILTLAECYARARQIAPSTLSHRARRSSTWLDRCATGNVTIRSAVGFVQWLSNNRPFGLEWPAGTDRPEPARGSPARAFFAPSSCVNGSATSFEAMPQRLQVVAKGREAQAPHPFGNETFVAAMRLGPLGADRLARGRCAGRWGSSVPSTTPWCAGIGTRLAPGAGPARGTTANGCRSRSQHLGGRSVCLAPDAAGGMSGLAIGWLGTGAVAATPAFRS